MLLTTSLFSQAQQFTLFVGTYTKTGSKGIYTYRFDAKTGNLTFLSSTDSAVNPSYLAISPNQKFLFAVNETNGNNPGKVSSYAINKQTGRLTFLSQQLTGGDDPCYVSVHKNNNWIAVANYSGGNASVLRVNSKGMLTPYSQLVQDSGKGFNKQRQEKAHVHAAIFSPDYQFLFTPDLGLDKIMAYRFNEQAQRPLKPATPAYAATLPGSGPRHLVFHPNNRFAYIIQELSGKVVAYKYSSGKFVVLQEVSSHPAGYTGDIGSADIHLSPDGKFLYASNRGDANNIAIFAVNQNTGRLTPRGYQDTKGIAPRNFMIDPTGNFLLVANQQTDNVVIFKRNKTTGALSAIGKTISIPRPVCLKMM
jgi:6-phosphogluconolactonase